MQVYEYFNSSHTGDLFAPVSFRSPPLLSLLPPPFHPSLFSLLVTFRSCLPPPCFRTNALFLLPGPLDARGRTRVSCFSRSHRESKVCMSDSALPAANWPTSKAPPPFRLSFVATSKVKTRRIETAVWYKNCGEGAELHRFGYVRITYPRKQINFIS